MKRDGVCVLFLLLYQKQVRAQGVDCALSILSASKDTALCHMFSAQNVHCLLQHAFIELLLYASPAPDTEKHPESRRKAGRLPEKWMSHTILGS